MAVNAVPLGSRLQLRLVAGHDAEGSPIYRTRSYAGVKPLAADQAVFAVGSALANLQQHPLEEVRRVNEYLLVEE